MSKKSAKPNIKFAAQRLETLAKRIQARVSDALEEGAQDMAETVKRSMTSVAQERHKEGKSAARTSRPGEPPAIVSGDLLDSIHVVEGEDELQFEVEANSPYAKFLEFGTRSMEARPFLAPAELEHRGAIKERTSKALREVIAKKDALL